MEKILAAIVEKIRKMAKPGYKQVILVRDDLDLPKGKMAAQVAHASVDAVMNSEKKMVDGWRQQGMKKIVLSVRDEKELLNYRKLAGENGLVSALITDAGKTVVKSGTKTCLAIGPDNERKINRLTGSLKTM